MTCVGLGLEVLRRLSAIDSRLAAFTYIASCEELVENLPAYVENEPSQIKTEKEHVLVALRFSIGGRAGVLLLDPGYHIARVITVMQDSKYPHTGWFTQSEEGQMKKEYSYSFASPTCDYIVWKVKQTRGVKESVEENLIYVGRCFENPIDLTERRNLVYNFRSWLSRNTKGHITAGIYFPIVDNHTNTAHFTLMYSDLSHVKQRIKLPFTKICNQEELSLEEKQGLELCGHQLNLREGELNNILRFIATALADSLFIRQLLQINEDIKTSQPVQF